MRKMTVLKAFFPLIILLSGIANAQAPNSVPLSPTQIQGATNTAIAPSLPGGITANSLNTILNQFDPFTNLWFDASNVQNGLLNKWSGTAWVPLVIAAGNGGTGAATATANTLLAGPTTGSPVAPAFRALVAADIAALSPSFTNLTVTGALSGAGVTALFASPPCIGCTAAGVVDATTFLSTGLATLNSLSAGSAAQLTVSSTGSLAQTPTTPYASGAVPGINTTYSATGSAGTATSATISALNVTTDTLAVSGAPGNAFLNLQTIQDTNFGGSTATGGRIMLYAALTQTAASASYNAFPDYVGAQGSINSLSGDGGTVGTPKGNYYGLWGTASLGPLAAFVGSLQSLELDINAANGSSVSSKSMLLLAHLGGDTAHGSVVDANIWMFNANGSVGANQGILFGRTDGFGGLGVGPTGTLLATANEVATIGSGFDLTGGGNTTITNFAWKSPGASIDGSGNGKLNTLGLPATAGQVFWGTNSGTNGGQILLDQTSTNMFFDDLAGGSWTFRTTGGTTEASISNTGIFSSAGTAGVTCATGSPTASFSSKGGLVTHC